MKELPTIVTSTPDQQHQQPGSYTYAKTVDTTIKHTHYTLQTTHTHTHTHTHPCTETINVKNYLT